MPTTHRLKTLPQFWTAIERGDKTFEVRKDDRAYQAGDTLALVYHDPKRSPDEYEGFARRAPIMRRVTFVLPGGQFGVEPGYVAMSLAEVDT